ncbi:MAG: lytic murein transglycosylase B [Gammaproteobacteria bacterium]
MNRAIPFVRIGLTLVFLISCSGVPENKKTGPMDVFIREMAIKHNFDDSELHELFQSVHIEQDILDKMASPAEGLPWHKYREIFLTRPRIEGGINFLKDHAKVFSAVEQRYGIPAEIIVAILGVETFYGKNTGNHRVIDSLSTLAFAYPPRSQFFSAELENFLLLCREERLNPLKPKGSYAGAMGMPQFMPSSFRSYSADFDKDGRRDIWHNPADVIASVANYLAEHGWHPGQVVAVPATATGDDYKSLLNDNLKDFLRIDVIKSARVQISHPLPLYSKVKLLAFKHEHGEELWAVLNNFYVITRYNHSPLYAMAVYQLSQAISNQIN